MGSSSIACNPTSSFCHGDRLEDWGCRSVWAKCNRWPGWHRSAASARNELIIAWQLAKSSSILPIPGSRRLDHILDCLAAVDVRLDDAEVRRLDAISPSDLPRRERPAAWEGMPPLARLDAEIQ